MSTVKAAIEDFLRTKMGYETAEVWGDPIEEFGVYIAVVAVESHGPLVRMQFRRAAPVQMELFGAN